MGVGTNGTSFLSRIPVPVQVLRGTSPQAAPSSAALSSECGLPGESQSEPPPTETNKCRAPQSAFQASTVWPQKVGQPHSPQGLAFWPAGSPCGGSRPFQMLSSAPPVCQWSLLGVRPQSQTCLRAQPLSGHPLSCDQTLGKLQPSRPASGKSWLPSWVLRSPWK